jgi:hypothetical protein
MQTWSQAITNELPILTNPIITIIYPEILVHQIIHPHLSYRR